MKKEINIKNYEQYVVDFIEGNLTPHMESLFNGFLQEHPEIAEEIADLNDIGLPGDNIIFNNKKDLKKPPVKEVGGISEENYENYFVAYNEGDLNLDEKQKVSKFLKSNSSLSEEFNIHQRIKLEVDPKIIFAHKDKLRKKTKISYYRYASVAAALLILIGWSYTRLSTTNASREIISISRITSSISSSSINNNISESIIAERSLFIIPEYNNNDEPFLERNALSISAIDTRNRLVSLSDITDYKSLISPKKIDYSYYLASNENDVTTNKNKKRSLFASVISNQWNKLSDRFSTSSTRPNIDNDPTYVQVLETSITVFNTITGSETRTSKTYNSEGELTSYQVEGRELVMNRNRGTNSSQ